MIRMVTYWECLTCNRRFTTAQEADGHDQSSHSMEWASLNQTTIDDYVDRVELNQMGLDDRRVE